MPELNWRNPGDYAYLEGLNLHEWAWEFLRRNPAYREAYFAYEPYAAMEYHGRLDTPEQRAMFGELYREASEPWGLGFPVDPRLRDDEGYPLFMGKAGVSMPASWNATPFLRGHLWPGYPHQVAFVFDFHHSIDVQIEAAAKRLRRFAQHIAEEFNYEAPKISPPKGLRIKQFPLYARILDAELAGATIGAMGRELFPENEDQRGNLKSMRTTARQWSRKGYRDLLVLPP